MTTLNSTPTGYIFLDVDGVLNPFDRKLGIDGWKLTKIEDYMVWIGQPLKATFKHLIDQGVQIVWATTWIEAPPGLRKLERLLGLPLLPQIDRIEWANPMERRGSCGKQHGIIRYLNANLIDPFQTPCVWVDDDLGPIDFKWAAARGVKTIQVPEIKGLSDPQQVARIEEAFGLALAVTV